VPWLRPAWIEAWLRAFGGGSPLVLALRRGGRLAAVLPLERRRRMLTSPSNWHTPEFGVLAEDEDARRELLAAAFASRPAAVQLAFLTPASGLAAFEDAARQLRYRLLVRTQQRSPYLDIDGDWDTFCESLDRKDIKEIRRRRRRLDEQGETRFDVEDGSERLDALFDEWAAVEASGWKGETGTAVASDPRTLEFYRTIARWAAGRGSLRLAFLRLDGRAIAGEFHIEDNRSLYNLKGGYDESLRTLSPGMISVHEVIRYAFARGLSTYEFLGGDEPFKRVWTKDVRERTSAQAFAPRPLGLGAYAAYAYGRPLAKRLLRR
jgi:CelD/BcsL family acetyltransferase involved in cellulose biosynthesis